MNYDAYTHEGVNFIEISGEINAENCGFLREEIMTRVKDTPHFILNCRNLTYMDSTGIGTLMAMSDMVNKGGGRIKLVGVATNVRRILDLVNASNMFDFFEGSEAALRDQQTA